MVIPLTTRLGCPKMKTRHSTNKRVSIAGMRIDRASAVPLHLQKAYTHLGYKNGDFPVTEKIAAEIVSLPMFPQLTPEQQDRVVQKVTEFVAVPSVR